MKIIFILVGEVLLGKGLKLFLDEVLHHMIGLVREIFSRCLLLVESLGTFI